MSGNKIVKAAFDHVSKNGNTSKIIGGVSFTAFLVAMTGIPGVSQAAALVDRWAGDKAAKRDLEKLWAEITDTNDRLEKCQDSLESVIQIANTVHSNSKLNKTVERLMSKLRKSKVGASEWEVLTKNWSCQTVLNSMVHANLAQITARNNSHNYIKNSTVVASKTRLVADGNSSNLIDGTTFRGYGGVVDMNGIRTQGDVSVQGASITLGSGGSIIFGGAPRVVTGECSGCKFPILLNVQHGVPSMVQCPKCRLMLNVPR